MTGRYQAYPKYKDSGVEWIGQYPSTWNITRVKFESYVKARVGWHGLKSDDFTDEGPYLVTGSDFRGPEINWNDCYHCDLERYKQDPYIQIRNGDLLITKDGTIGKVALVSNLDAKSTLNSGVFVVRPLTDNYTSKFYFWLLHSSIFTGFVDFNKIGSTIVHLYQDTFVNFKYAMPGNNEQFAVTNFLDHETAKIDTLIAKQQQLIKLLKEKRQAVISHAVTKGLNPDAPMRDSGVEWLGEVPEHWICCTLKHYGRVIDCKHITAEFFDEGIPLASISEVKEWFVNLETAKLTNEKYYLDLIDGGRAPQSGDIIYSRNATVGEAALVNENMPRFAMGQDVCLIRLNEAVLPKYALYVLKSGVISQQLDLAMVGSTFKRINVDDIRNFSIALPPYKEQADIANELSRVLGKYDLLILKAQTTIDIMQERRTALISAAVAGKIDVRNWQAPEQNQTNKEKAA